MTEENTTRKSVRLGKQGREDIINSIMEEFEINFFKNSGTGFANKDELVKGYTHLELQIMEGLWMRKYAEHAPLLDVLPTGFVDTWSFQVFATNQKTKSVSIPKRPGNGNKVDLVITEEEWDEIWAPAVALRELKSKFEEEQKSFKSEVRSVIESCNTTKQLLEVWPKAEPYLPAYLSDPDQGIKLPALQISRLEERLAGL